jgi:acyl carrier protein
MVVLKIIYEAIDELNLDLEQEEQIEKGEETTIFGPESKLDSMGLVNLITIIEEKLEAETGVFYALADERAMSLESSPFKTVSTLKQYISGLISS